ncbi:LPXTG cell wall anchor domain-containing protein [Actinoplanes sp. G11-F43]|uniref:LPXTG cell wall anchor domain-containing protein n=1 Tax=Actinoplanes sp. G11-F43 TaxID=3424130 RepID=UPI003D34705C
MSPHTGRMLAALAVIGAVVLAPSPASAHPFGDPQTVVVSLDDQRPDVVRVRWRVGGPDDLTVLGMRLGLLPADRARADGTVDYRHTDPGVVGSSAEFAAYLLERITVGDGTRECAGVIEPVRALALKGATADFTCAGPVSEATVAVRMLTDLHPAYRTMATGPNGSRAVYDSGHDTHVWARATVSTGGGAPARIAAVLGVFLLLAAAVVVLRRRRVTA